jgi:hypothetical protein
MKWVDLRKNFPTQLIKLYNMIENFTITNYWIIGKIKSSFDKMNLGDKPTWSLARICVRIKLHIYVTNMHYDIPTCCKDIL